MRDLNQCVRASFHLGTGGSSFRRRKYIGATLALSMSAYSSTSVTSHLVSAPKSLATRATTVLDKISFGIPVSGQQIEILQEPAEFYSHLVHMVERAQSRVCIATLYLGTGAMESRLVDALSKRMADRPELDVHVHLDYLRGNRLVDGVNSSVSMLKPIFNHSSNSKATVTMYHTPELNGWKRYMLPNRYNEVLGVSHFKCFVVDDDVILTGANLSHSYFTDRQDRYIRFRNCKRLADFYCNLVSCVGDKLSFKYKGDEDVVEPVPSPVTQSPLFKEYANKVLSEYLLQDANNGPSKAAKQELNNDDLDTLVYPLVQMRPFGIQQDETAISTLFETLRDQSIDDGDKYRLIMSTGYFNLTQELEDRLLDFGNNAVRLLCASQQANGFHGGRGLAGYVPHAYSHILESFMHKVNHHGLKYKIVPWLYDRPGWTYHAKGFWLYDHDNMLPSVMSIGSPNYGHRSTFKDLESECILITQNHDLQKRMQTELEALFKFSTSLGTDRLDLEGRNAMPDHEIAKWVPIVLPFIRTML